MQIVEDSGTRVDAHETRHLVVQVLHRAGTYEAAKLRCNVLHCYSSVKCAALCCFEKARKS